MIPFRVIQVGTGGRGGYWCSQILPPNIKDGLIKVVAAVDINPDVLGNACEHLGLSEEKCYTDIVRAFDENEADFCTIVVPPAFHEEVIDIALAHEMHILSEKQQPSCQNQLKGTMVLAVSYTHLTLPTILLV